jgi:VWFA-related protein
VRILNSPNQVEQLNVSLVELYTTVVDRNEQLVRGLTADDFEILDRGVPQEIIKFELVENLPLTVGITIDTSGSMASSLVEAQRAGRLFLDRVLTPRDRCFVVGFSGRPVLRMPPTSDVESCGLGLEGLQAEGWTALHDAVVTSLYHMRELSGQRALVLLSDGDDTVSSVDFDEALEYARKSGVAIFTIGLDVSALSLEVRRKLSRLATETGGRTFYVQKAEELGSVYDEIERELRSRYLIAYAPSVAGKPDEFRAIEVKVRRGLKARTIRGYYP